MIVANIIVWFSSRNLRCDFTIVTKYRLSDELLEERGFLSYFMAVGVRPEDGVNEIRNNKR